MTKSPTRELPPQTNEEPPPRRRNVYDYDGEYEFCTVQHWSPECPTEQLRLAIFSGFGFAVAQAHSLGVMRLHRDIGGDRRTNNRLSRQALAHAHSMRT